MFGTSTVASQEQDTIRFPKKERTDSGQKEVTGAIGTHQVLKLTRDV